MAGAKRTGHHSVYVVYLRNPKGDGKAGYYVGMTGLSPEVRFQNHKSGIRAARVVRKYGERLVPKLYSHLNPMSYEKAQWMEAALADSLRKRGFVVYGAIELGRLRFRHWRWTIAQLATICSPDELGPIEEAVGHSQLHVIA